jgi:hypothetical protein
MRKFTEQEEKEYFDKYKPTLKDKIEDWFYGLVDRIDNSMIMILSLCTVLGILVLIKLLF